eukprot:scaffold2033_cov367-Prasinococcus_capsulatus_cf.AAC.17
MESARANPPGLAVKKPGRFRGVALLARNRNRLGTKKARRGRRLRKGRNRRGTQSATLVVTVVRLGRHALADAALTQHATLAVAGTDPPERGPLSCG